MYYIALREGFSQGKVYGLVVKTGVILGVVMNFEALTQKFSVTFSVSLCLFTILLSVMEESP